MYLVGVIYEERDFYRWVQSKAESDALDAICIDCTQITLVILLIR